MDGRQGAIRPRAISRRAMAACSRSLVFWDHWSGLDGGDDLPNATIIVGAPHSAAPPFLILTPAPPPFSATNSTAAALAWMRYAEAGRA